jgi:hypothetical protein
MRLYDFIIPAAATCMRARALRALVFVQIYETTRVSISHGAWCKEVDHR